MYKQAEWACKLVQDQYKQAEWASKLLQDQYKVAATIYI